MGCVRCRHPCFSVLVRSCGWESCGWDGPAFLTSTPVDETACPLRPLGRPEKRIIQISFRIFTYSYSPRRRFEPTHKEPLPAGEAMRIRGKPTDTHTTPLHARGGRYTRRSGGGSAIALDETTLHYSTRGFAAREARQPAPASSSGEASGWYILRAKGQRDGWKIGQRWSV